MAEKKRKAKKRSEWFYAWRVTYRDLTHPWIDGERTKRLAYALRKSQRERGHVLGPITRVEVPL